MAAASAMAGGADAVRPPAKADLGAWLAVAAGTLGALMATLDISIVNSALPTIQGEIGASGTEGTWVATSYLVAEIVIIPMAAWLERMLGLRTFLLVAAGLFTGFSVVCGTASTLTMMIIGRVGQGFTGGAMIPTAQTIIAQRLPPSQQPVGIALFGVTAIMGPVIGPLIGGWLTENLSWHYAFFINVPICAALVILLLVGMPHRKPRIDLLVEADWLGILGLAMGLGGLTVLLEEGQREQWFSSSFIQTMAVISGIGFASLFAGQVMARRPIIKLSLLLDRQFGAVALMGIVLGMVLYGTSYVIPQFLAAIANYDSLQSGKIVLLSGIPSLIVMALIPILMRTVDIRIAVGGGLLIMAGSSFLDASLTIESAGGDFVVSQLLRGVGQILGMIFLSQAVVRSVPPEDAGDASGLFNSVRNLGGSLALAGIATLQDQRLWFHSRRLEETLSANAVAVQDYVGNYSAAMGGASGAINDISRQIAAQALVMTFNDIFWIMAVGTMIALPLVFFLRPLPQGAAPAAMH
ncbi:disulfide bond formation protein DsbA [Sphingomonas sp. Root710]|uniref:MDR family MFS transporter n=1 Tax=Sphingomonas sp. Root710 TaxID=1736594 RepID=UPI0006FBD45F|nr:MDR family MFS transporter [Sphingomonas sp. Root710]KRB85373.1 disulfide bond formation protein DsbA [Sphingomonas sp. Root710]